MPHTHALAAQIAGPGLGARTTSSRRRSRLSHTPIGHRHVRCRYFFSLSCLRSSRRVALGRLFVPLPARRRPLPGASSVAYARCTLSLAWRTNAAAGGFLPVPNRASEACYTRHGPAGVHGFTSRRRLEVRASISWPCVRLRVPSSRRRPSRAAVTRVAPCAPPGLGPRWWRYDPGVRGRRCGGSLH